MKFFMNENINNKHRYTGPNHKTVDKLAVGEIFEIDVTEGFHNRFPVEKHL